MNRKHTLREVIFFSVLSGVLAALCFPPCGFRSLTWVCLVPWLYTLSREQSIKQMLLSHGLFQTAFFFLGLSWMACVHPVCPIVILIPLYFMCLPFPLLFRWSVQELKIPIFIAAPILWTAQDYLRSFLFSGFPYLFLGYPHATQSIVQIADITGVYGVTFLVVLVNSLILTWLQWYLQKRTDSPQKIIYPLVCTVVTVLLLSGAFWYGEKQIQKISYNLGPKVASIQGNIPQDLKEDSQKNRERILQVYTDLTAQALDLKPELLLWPETMSPEDVTLDPQMNMMFKDIARETPCHLLIGSHLYDCDFTKKDYKLYNTAYYMNPEGKIIDRYDKIRLVIIGEFVPLRHLFPVIPALIKNLAGFVPDLQRGNRRPVFSLGQNRFGCLICYDIAYSDDARALRKAGCEFIVNLTNEGWFFDTSELEQLLQISIFRAVENRMGLLRSGNSGITLTIPPTGRMRKENILTMPIEKYATSLPPYLAERIVGKSTLAWHHLPAALWRPDSDFLTTKEKNWDVILDGQQLKWKDFAGIFCQKVPLSSPELPFYTRHGDLFSLVLSGISLSFLAAWVYRNIKK